MRLLVNLNNEVKEVSCPTDSRKFSHLSHLYVAISLESSLKNIFRAFLVYLPGWIAHKISCSLSEFFYKAPSLSLCTF